MASTIVRRGRLPFLIRSGLVLGLSVGAALTALACTTTIPDYTYGDNTGTRKVDLGMFLVRYAP
jgi:hypothetical protein